MEDLSGMYVTGGYYYNGNASLLLDHRYKFRAGFMAQDLGCLDACEQVPNGRTLICKPFEDESAFRFAMCSFR